MVGSAEWQLEDLFHQTHKVQLQHCLSEIPAFPRELLLPMISSDMNELGVMVCNQPEKSVIVGILHEIS